MTTKVKGKRTEAPADAVDEQLARYRSMRDFGVTAEPSGGAASRAKSGLPFVIQKHAASHLHYDFRLGWNGVLKSWAVAKGPSYVTADKRLAVQVEDHPMEYGGFEGIIPQGQYGGGTVMVWDQGTWEPQAGHTDVDEGLRSGSLKIVMHGTKMQGKWALVRMGGKAANERKPNWLLIKEHDEFERGKDDPAITEEAAKSVVTGRDLEEIARNEDHVWNSKETAKGNAWHRKDPPGENDKPAAKVRAAKGSAAHVSAAKGKPAAKKAATLAKDPEEKLPDFVEPQLALQVLEAREDDGWLHELKLDGYRMQARKEGGTVQMLTRSGLDWTHRMKAIADQIAALDVGDALLDGEVVVLAANGTTSFADLQAAFQEGAKKTLTYFVFDLLHLDGHNLRGMALTERKALLAQVLDGAAEQVQMSEHLVTSGKTMFLKACELHAEGIVSKRASSSYTSGRNGDWLKVKCIHDQEFVIGGFTLPSNGTHGIGALLLGYYEGKKLVYAGRTGTGFTQKTHASMRDQLQALRQTACAFETLPAGAKTGAVWVKPKLVAQINFATWTAEHLLRQASFKGLREDKAAADVVNEDGAAPVAKEATHTSKAARAKRVAEPAAVSPMRPKGVEHAPVRLTHPDKIVDAPSSLTKQQLADYYWAIAPKMLPHIAGRPLSLVRCPDGSEKPCFYQKHQNHMLPPGIGSIDVPDKKTGKMEPYITLSTPEALAGLAQMGVLEVHPWGSHNEDLEHPDRIVIDLDPDAAISWETLAASAAEVRKELKKLGLESFLKLTGGKGLHVVIRVEPTRDWTVIKQFAHAFVLRMERQRPSLYLTKMSKAARKDRIYLDYLRNERGSTAVAAFSPRARAGVAVSLPLKWSDLKLPELPIFHVAEYGIWARQVSADPWKNLASTRQELSDEILKELNIKT